MDSHNEKDNAVDPNGESSNTEENIQRLQVMINEALQGKGTLDTDSEFSNFNQDLSDQTGNMFNSMEGGGDDSNLSLGKLYLKFRNLDFRLTRVEEIIIKREDLGLRKDVKKRVTNHSRPGFHSVDPGYLNQNDPNFSPSSRLNSLISINPILTSSGDILTSLDSYQGSSVYSLPSIDPTSTSFKAQRKDEIKRSNLDYFCLPLLESDPKPSTEMMQEIVNSISSIYPNVTQKQLLSKVREWFRKRREYMSQRIFQACSEIYKDFTIENESDLENAISILDQRPDIIDAVLKNADLETTDNVVAREYCHEKILSYFNSLYKPPMLKKRQ